MADANGTTVMCQGRIVWTSGKTPFTGKPKVDQTTKQPRLGKNNEPLIEYGFGLAVPKESLQAGQVNADLWAAIHNEAFTLYPSRQIPPAFAWKYKDGDGIDHNGVSFAQREGHAGHMIFACTTTIPVKFFRHENGVTNMVNDGIKCGDYVQVQLGVKAHAAHGQGKPGLYLNPNAALFLREGKEIVNAPSGEQIFGASAPAVPAWVPAAPPMQQFAPPTGQPTFANPGYGAPPAFNPSMQQAPSVAPPPTAQPHYGVLPAAHQPQMQPPMQQAPMGYAPPQQPQYQQAPPQMAPPQQYAQPQAAPQAPMGYAPPAAMPQPGGFPGMPPIPGGQR